MKISDFRLSEYFIRKFCSKENLTFNDLEVIFDKETGLINNTIHLHSDESYKLSQTIYQIVSTYITNIEKISKQEIDLKKNINIPKEDVHSFLNIVLSIVRDMTYGESSINGDSLNNFPVIWILFKDLICPAFNVPTKNIHISVQKTPYIDGAKYFSDLKDQPLIILNENVQNPIYRLGFLFIEAIIAHDLNPSEVILNLFSKTELKERFIGFLKLVHFDTEEVNTLISLISSIFNFELNNIKVAQTVGQTWWYIGLIERMLEPARGPDWSIYNQTKNDSKELWEKIEEKKKKLGLNQLPFDTLLRIQSEDFALPDNEIIQKLLSDVRVW